MTFENFPGTAPAYGLRRARAPAPLYLPAVSNLFLQFADKLQFKLPYINTSLLVNELVNLQYETKNNVVRVFEKTGFRKDRYSSLSYNYWIIKQLELKLNRPKHELDFKSGYFCFRRPKIK